MTAEPGRVKRSIAEAELCAWTVKDPPVGTAAWTWGPRAIVSATETTTAAARAGFEDQFMMRGARDSFSVWNNDSTLPFLRIPLCTG